MTDYEGGIPEHHSQKTHGLSNLTMSASDLLQNEIPRSILSEIETLKVDEQKSQAEAAISSSIDSATGVEVATQLADVALEALSNQETFEAVTEGAGSLLEGVGEFFSAIADGL